jgi:hypothetical protein
VRSNHKQTTLKLQVWRGTGVINFQNIKIYGRFRERV